MVMKIETLLCVQEFVKDRALMEKYFNERDIEDLSKYCSAYSDMDLDDPKEAENVARLIQLLLSTDLHKYSEKYSDDVRCCEIFFKFGAKKFKFKKSKINFFEFLTFFFF
jgi:hypothetical protein